MLNDIWNAASYNPLCNTVQLHDMLTVKKKTQNQSNFYAILSLHILTKNVYYVLPHDTQSKHITFKTLAYASENLNILIYNF